ncbi:MAG: Rpn family recombination-promoting nuclease/putative transposase [Nannocystaceae bacterium]
MKRLDPTLDVVFKRLLTRRRELLVDMLEGILDRTIVGLEIIEPEIPGQEVGSKRVIFDIRVVLDDGTRVDIEMQRRGHPALRARLAYYGARNLADQLQRGQDYDALAPTVVIAWLREPLLTSPERLHCIFELRERQDHRLLDDRISIHVLQISGTSSPTPNAKVERWARFFRARDDVDFEQLASEDPIMAIATQTLDELSQDPETRRLARKIEDEAFFYRMGLALSREQGKTEGQAELLLKLLDQRFGPLDDSTTGRVMRASPRQLDSWAERVLTAGTLDDVLAV